MKRFLRLALLPSLIALGLRASADPAVPSPGGMPPAPPPAAPAGHEVKPPAAPDAAPAAQDVAVSATHGAAAPTAHDAAAAAAPVSAAKPAGEHLEVPPPPFSDGIFPCSQCHDGSEVNRTRRVLTDAHTDIVLKHDAEHRWCLDCHDPVQRDSLHLASGERIPFDESYRLCGQCHGEKFRDWKAGVHGRRTGEWNGHKMYLLCAHCHNPHQPHFQSLAPKPPPSRPERPQEGAAPMAAGKEADR